MSIRQYILEKSKLETTQAWADVVNTIVTVGSGIMDLIRGVKGSGFGSYMRKKRSKKELNNMTLKTGALVQAIKNKDQVIIKRLEQEISKDLPKLVRDTRRIYASELTLAGIDYRASKADVDKSFNNIFRKSYFYSDVSDIHRNMTNYRYLRRAINDSQERYETSMRPEPDYYYDKQGEDER